MEPEVRLLRYFVAVAEHLNFTRAADRLRIAQPSLSAQIRQLETQLGVKLLDRTTRSVRLTDAGKALYEAAPSALAALEQAYAAARRVGRGEAGQLRLAYSNSVGYETAPRLVQALRDQYPDIAVTTEVLETPEIVRAVRDGRLEAGVARTPTCIEGVRLQVVRHERQGVLVRSDHPLASRSEVALAAVARYPLLMHPRAANPAHYDAVLELFARAGLHPRLFEPAVAFDPSHRAIREGRAIALGGVSVASSITEGLCWTPIAAPAPTMPVVLVLAAGSPSGTARRFEQVALATARAEGWLAGGGRDDREARPVNP